MSSDKFLVNKVDAVPDGLKCHQWTLNAVNRKDHYGKVRLDESPFYLHLFCMDSEIEDPHEVGIFKLDLKGLLDEGYIRHDPVHSAGTDLRLRIVSDSRGFHIQTNGNGDGVPLL